MQLAHQEYNVGSILCNVLLVSHFFNLNCKMWSPYFCHDFRNGYHFSYPN